MMRRLLDMVRPQARPNRVVRSEFGPMIINVNDRFIGHEISRAGRWEVEEVRLILKLSRFLVQQHGSILAYDVGANVGQYSLALAKTFGARISLRAFEPQRPVFHMLCGTMALNNCLNVKLECAVVSDQDGHQIRIVLPDYDAANNFGALEFEAVQASDNSLLRFSDKEDAVPTVTLDSYAERPHLIKIDAEGMEMKVLQGAARTVANARPVCMVETGKTGLEPVRSFFAGHNYKLFPRGQNAIAIPGELFANRDFLCAVGVPA